MRKLLDARMLAESIVVFVALALATACTTNGQITDGGSSLDGDEASAGDGAVDGDQPDGDDPDGDDPDTGDPDGDDPDGHDPDGDDPDGDDPDGDDPDGDDPDGDDPDGDDPDGDDPVDPCDGVDCGDHGLCVASAAGTASCDCDPGFVEESSTCVMACELPLPEDGIPDSEGGVPFGFLDGPVFDSTACRNVEFRGWVLSPVPLASVDLFIDDVHVAPLPLVVDRSDVCAAYPTHACETAGYSVNVDVTGLTSCHHIVEVRATAEGGEVTVIDRARLFVEPPPPWLDLGEAEAVHSIVDNDISLALDMIVYENEVIACFGSWFSLSGGWDSHCRNLQTGAEERGAGDHETAGVGLAIGAPGVLIGYEADHARSHGGPAAFGSGILMNNGAHYWQSVSVGHGFAIAGAARISDFAANIFIGEADGAGPWSLLGQEGIGVPHRQTFVDPYHLIFTMGWDGFGSARLIRIAADRSMSVVAYSGLPAGCQGVGTAEEVPGVGLVAGTYSDDLPWRGGSGAHIGRLDPATGATSDWRPLGGADVIDILPLDDDGSFAVSVNFPARVLIFDRELTQVGERALTGTQVGGLALLDGYLYAASASSGRADVVRFPVIEPIEL